MITYEGEVLIEFAHFDDFGLCVDSLEHYFHLDLRRKDRVRLIAQSTQAPGFISVRLDDYETYINEEQEQVSLSTDALAMARKLYGNNTFYVKVEKI